ncbi:hypothetical protein SEA_SCOOBYDOOBYDOO_107 [Mycobacterium phage ScoobyDoobyDoo]|nr:hypothetical protein SEA_SCOOBYDOOBYDOO_107 [Mycobacterium phage ScoobyDoobyDoo]
MAVARYWDGAAWRKVLVRRSDGTSWEGTRLDLLGDGPPGVVQFGEMIASAEQVYAPASLAYGIEVGVMIASAEQIYAPTVAPGSVGITIGSMIPSAEQVYTPASVTNPHDPATTTFSSTGSWSYTIPFWATHLTVVGIGGGRSGNSGGSTSAGVGGAAGSWNGVTVAVASLGGVTTLSGTVGTGGSPSGNNGAATTCTQLGLTCAGGSGGSPAGRSGQDAGNYTFDGVTYTGGAGGSSAGSNSAGSAGDAPGGGGQGGGSVLFVGQAGGAGGAGRLWVVAKRIL